VATATAPSSFSSEVAPTVPGHADHPRILLTADRLAVVRGLRAAGAVAWKTLEAHCDEDASSTIPAGYEGWDWANAALDLAACNIVGPRAEYARAAIRYLRALLDDRFVVGDGAGGDNVVAHDDGYPIRTHGCFGAIAYDWLHDAPGMTPALRAHALDRFVAWSRWFSGHGYNRDQPISNYYIAFFGAQAFAGIAGEGDDPRAGALLDDARRMYASEIAPAFTRRLPGGDFPEGWQYGDLVGAVLAIFVDVESRVPGRSLTGDLPWLGAVVDYRAHALWPDGRHTFDTGDWSEKPATAPAHTVALLATVLPASGDSSRRARGLARLAVDPAEEWHWLDVLATDPSRPGTDPRTGPRSYVAPGTGTVTARTDWSPDAVWFALASAPSLSDHQHLDAGHFEIVRGSDALVVDSGGYGSYSSLSHNVVAVDDHRENDEYAPNQGLSGHDARIGRFDDDGRFVYALADYASAYDPAGYPADHPHRSVVRAEREVVFSRAPVQGMPPQSARIVLYDRFTLSKPTYATTFLLHGGAAPDVRAGSVRFVVGRSSALVTSLLPRNAVPVVVHEPTNLGSGPYYANDPPEGRSSTRIEVPSPADGTERRFLHVVVVSTADAKAVSVLPVDGEGIDGVAVADEAYVFTRGGVQRQAAPESYRAPASATHHFVASLVAGAAYSVNVAPERGACRVDLQPGAGARTSDAGTLTLDLAPGCVLTPPGRASRAASAP
jgi:hypothetical protein